MKSIVFLLSLFIICFLLAYLFSKFLFNLIVFILCVLNNKSKKEIFKDIKDFEKKYYE